MEQAAILVVDDEPDNFEVIEMLLFNEGYNLNYVSNGAAALAYLEHNKVDAILLDVMMPGLNGVEVCRQIRETPHSQHIPIIMVTALSGKNDLARCLDAGADDFVSKPVNGIELRARVRSILRIKLHHDMLQNSLQLREDMSNMIVHDLRNPLSSIMLACTILQMTDLQEKQQKKVGQIAIAGQQLQSMIDSLLLMAKLDAGKLLINRTEVDLCAIATSALNDLTEIAAQKDIELIGELPEVGGSVFVDITVMRRVFDNLLSNAIKFSPSHSQVTLRVAYPEEHRAQIQFIDQGAGVKEDLRQSIFEKFEIGSALNGVSQTGLGLAFCKMAIAAHDGTISVENNVPKGAIFTISL